MHFAGEKKLQDANIIIVPQIEQRFSSKDHQNKEHPLILTNVKKLENFILSILISLSSKHGI
jgi:hypothetical protein